MGPIKEYILVIEGSVLSLPALSAVILIQTDRYEYSIVRYCRQSGERLGECFLWTTKGGGADPSITNINSLGPMLSYQCLISKLFTVDHSVVDQNRAWIRNFDPNLIRKNL